MRIFIRVAKFCHNFEVFSKKFCRNFFSGITLDEIFHNNDKKTFPTEMKS